MQKSKTKTFPLIIGVIICAIAAIAFFFAFVGVKNETNIMTAKENLPSFTNVTSAELEVTPVSQSSVTDTDLTEDEFKDEYNGEFAITSSFLAGQRIDTRRIPEDSNASFGIVLPDERVVAVTSSLAGVAGALVTAGDVVDTQITDQGGGGNTIASTGDKVLCIAVTASDCQNVIPDGVSIPEDDSQSSGQEDVIVILAVPEGDAGTLAGQPVNLALNPFCTVDTSGYFESPRGDQGKEFTCRSSDGRLAGKPQPADDTGTTGTTGVTDEDSGA